MNDDSLLWHLWLCNISLWIAIQNGGDMWQEPSSEFTLISLASFSASSPLITTSNVCINTRVLYLHTYYHDDHCHLYCCHLYMYLYQQRWLYLTMLHLSKKKRCVYDFTTLLCFHHSFITALSTETFTAFSDVQRVNRHHFSLPKSYLLALTLHTLDLTLEDRFELLPVYRW